MYLHTSYDRRQDLISRLECLVLMDSDIKLSWKKKQPFIHRCIVVSEMYWAFSLNTP